MLTTYLYSTDSPEVQYMDKLFEDDIKLFCVDVVLNHFGCLKGGEKKRKSHDTFTYVHYNF